MTAPTSTETETNTTTETCGVMDCSTSSSLGMSLRNEVSASIYNALEEMYHGGRHTDTEIIVGEKSFRCHKVVLACMSQYFDAMFSSGMRECYDGVVRLKGIESSTFQNILDFIYSGKQDITTDNVEDLLKAASMFQIKSLHEKCEEFLINHVSAENCIGAWKLARCHECKDLSSTAWHVILEYFPDVCRTEDFNLLDADDITDIITDDELNVTNEEIVCECFFRWYRFDPDNRREHASKLFEYLRLPLLSSEYLLHEVEPMDLVVENPRCREIVKEAISYQMLPSRRPDFYSLRTTHRKYAQMEEVLVVVGGYNAVGEKVLDVMAYSFLRRRWFALSSLPYKVGREFATCVYGADIFVSGGSQKLENLLQYRSEHNEWVKCSNMLQGRRRHAMVALGESIYVIGGYDDNTKEENERTVNDIGEYNMTSRSWQAVGQLTIPVRSMTAAVSKEKVLVFGGIMANDQETNIVQCFDTRLHTCVQISELPYPCKLNKSVVCDKRVFIVCTEGNVLELTDDMKCQRMAKIKSFNRRRFSALHHKGNILIIGGECGSSVLRDMFTFNPDTEQLTVVQKKDFPHRANFGGVKILIQKKFLIAEIKVEKGEQS